MKEIIDCSFNDGLDFLFPGLFYYILRQRLIWKILFSRDANNFFPVKLIASSLQFMILLDINQFLSGL